MKIRKAIEKAKLAREKEDTFEARFTTKAAIQEGRLPPVYTESRHAEPDYKKMAENKCSALSSESPYPDAFRVLRTRINNLIQCKAHKTLMITSAHPGEGKTTTAVNLALTYAKEIGQTVLLVDCDLRRQDVHKFMGIESDRGLVDYLAWGTPLKDIIIWPGIEKFTFISGGRTIPDGTELLESSRMHGLVEEIKNRYPDRFVIFDTPPVLAGAESIAFTPLVDNIILVVGYGKTSIMEVKNILDLIPTEKFLGFVLNRSESRKDPYGYY